MNLRIIVFFFLPLLYQAQLLPTSAQGQVTFVYETVNGPTNGAGVLGSNLNRAYASLIKENFTESQSFIFNKIQFETLNFGGKKGSVFLCLFENKNGLPGQILPGGKILVKVPSKKALITANISKLKIPVPDKGYFVGFEWARSKENTITGLQATSEKPYNPAIGGILNPENNLFVLGDVWKKAEDQLVSQLNVAIDYLPASL